MQITRLTGASLMGIRVLFRRLARSPVRRFTTDLTTRIQRSTDHLGFACLGVLLTRLPTPIGLLILAESFNPTGQTPMRTLEWASKCSSFTDLISGASDFTTGSLPLDGKTRPTTPPTTT